MVLRDVRAERLFINDKQVGEIRIEQSVAARFGIDTVGVGFDTGAPVSNTYTPPFAFTGDVLGVTVDLTPPVDPTPQADR